jgi:myo-inositol 2-dehydrogenase/D-chiro-inositol 1-dehydrogenase
MLVGRYRDEIAETAGGRRRPARGDDREAGVSVGFGIVGSGLMAGVYANALKDDTRNTRFVGVTVGSRAPGLAEKYGVEHIPTFEAMLERKDVDAVVLATPHSAHLPEALAAAKAGKHIFLEKPMGLSVAECRQMIEAAGDANVRITVGQVTRRMQASRVARRMIDQGELGDIRMLQTWRGQAGGTGLGADHWAANRSEGGSFLDWGSHGCDVVRWYAGAEPVLAFAQTTEYDPANQWQSSTMAQFTFANGVMGHIWMTYELPHAALGTRARYLVIGSKAILDIAAYGLVMRSREDGGWDEVYRADDFKGKDAGWGYPSRYMRDAFARQVQDLTNAIADGTPMEVSAEDGLRAVEMVEAATRSSETGQAVRLPLA